MNLRAPDLSGQVAIVTGASRGIGRALALGLARAGGDVVVAARSTESTERLPGTIHDTVDEVRTLGRRALAVPCDVRHEEDLDRLVAETLSTFGRIDVLINNAGALFWKPVAQTPAKRFDLVMDVNARASFLLSKKVLPTMTAQGRGHILVMSPPLDPSLATGRVAYAISKLGMTLIALGLAEEVRGDGIAVNALWPATAIESQATIGWRLGSRDQWRRPDIMVDATLAILGHEPPSLTGRAMLDEEILAESGVSDFSGYNCVEGGEPLRIVGEGVRHLGVGGRDQKR